MADAKMKCPNPECSSADVRFRPKLKDWTCDECGHCWKAPAPVEPPRSLRIFLSYGHDEHTASAQRIKADLEARGHKVWFDAERLREGRDWEQYIEEGLQSCDKVVLLMTPHSVRRRNPRDPATRDGYCLNEIAKAIEKNKLIVPAMLVTLEDGPPTSICRIQYLDLRDCVPIAGNEACYQMRFERLARAIEQDDLDFEGGQARLQRLLRPLSFDAEMSRHIARFTGRQWLVAEIDRWLVDNPASRVFWLSGPPGIGKSAMATHLVHRRGDVIGYHLCVHGHDDKGDPSRAVLSLAYQVAQHLPEYDKALKALDLEQEVGKNAGTLFDNLFVKPLGGNFPAPDGPRLLVIDAIDEATRGGRNEIAELIRDHWDKVPSWLRLVITSRPEVEVVTTLGHLRPWVLDAQRAENLEDLRRYLERELAVRNLPHDERSNAAILAASEAVFLYVVVLLEEIDQGRMTLDHLDDLPVGLAGHYQRFFTRQYPDGAEYQAAIAPLLQCICAAREPLPLGVLARATDLSSNQVRARLVRVGSMFPIRKVADQEDTIRPFHKSVRDWLTALDEHTHLPRAGGYFVDAAAGEKRLADACWAEYRADVRSASAYSLRHLPGHLVSTGRGGDAAAALTDFGYHHQRLKVLGREDVVNITADFAVTDGTAGMVSAVRERFGVWKAFHAENAHFLRREVIGLAPETYLLQLAVAHADASPVTRSAERWLELVGPATAWLRSLRRPREVVRSACLRTLEGHGGYLDALALHPDGRRAVSGSDDMTLKVWDIETGECLRTLEGHISGVKAVALCPNGVRAVSAGGYDKTLRVWDIETGVCLRTLEGHTNSVYAVALHPDGKRAVSGSEDRTLKVWSLQTGACVLTLEGHTRSVNAIALHPDGKRVLSGSHDETVKIWDLETGQCLRTFRDTDFVHAVAFHADGLRAVSGSRRLKVWNIETGECLLTNEGNTHSIRALAMHPDSRRAVSVGDCNTLVVWDLESGQCIQTLECSTSRSVWSYAVVLHPDGRRAVSGNHDNTLKVWDIGAGEVLRRLDGHADIVSALSFGSHYKRAVSGSYDDTVKVWDIETGRCLRTLSGHGSTVVRCELFAGSNRAVSMDRYGTVKVWDVETCQCRCTFDGDATAFAVDLESKRVVSGSCGNTLKVSDLETGECLSILVGHSWSVISVALQQDRKRAVSGSRDNTLKIWDCETGHCLRTLKGHTDDVRSVALHSDGKRAVSTSMDKTLKVWDLDAGDCIRTLEGHKNWVNGVALHQDGKRAVSRSDDKTLKVWDLETGRCLQTLHGHTGEVRHVELLADGRCVLSVGADGSLKIWDIETGQSLATWGHDMVCAAAGPHVIAAGTRRGDVFLFRFMPPGRITPETTFAAWHPSRPLFVVASTNGTLLLQAWHPEAQHLEELVRTTIPFVAFLQWSADGTRLLATTRDGATHILDGITLQPASAPSAAWLPPTDTSSDGRWRAVIRDGRLEIVPANT